MNKVNNGFLLIDKPTGWTSFDVVNKVRYKLGDELGVSPKSIKVGHAGTLDPLATGLLIVLVGTYTKKQAQYMKLDKTYEAELQLGQNSTTDDSEGEKADVSDHRPEKKEVVAALESYIGQIEQTPPQFSAIKAGGKPAYTYARSGKQVDLRSRTVLVHKIKQIEYDYPSVRFVCQVSSGTYIRSLARDVGGVLNTGAYLSGLRRTSIGNYKINDALSVDALDNESIQRLLLS